MHKTALKKFSAAAVLAFAAVLPAGVGANAEDTTGDWTIVAQSQDPCGKMNPMRRGYYDLGNGNGWGWAKMYFKHQIYPIVVWRDTMTLTCGYQDQSGSTTWIYRARVYKLQCDSSGNQCVPVDSVILRAVNQRAQFNGQRKGLITMYCEGYIGPCPSWVNQYQGGGPLAPVRTQAMTKQGRSSDDDRSARFKMEAVGPPAAAQGPREDAPVTIESGAANSRAGKVLNLLRADLRNVKYAPTPTIVELRQVDSETVGILYSYPGFEGLLGLRRDVSDVKLDMSPQSAEYQLALNENSPREIATMLRYELEEPPPLELLVRDAVGVSWWGDEVGP